MKHEAAHFGVVISARNPGRFLKAALDSIAGQTFTDWEVVVVDDGSTEDLSWVPGYLPRTRLIKQKPQGVSTGRNTGVAALKTPFIAFLDADDAWAPTKLARQKEVFDTHPQVGMCISYFSFIDQEGAFVKEGYKGYWKDYLDLLKGCSIVTSSVVIKKEFLGDEPYRKDLFFDEDHDLYLRLTKNGVLIERLETPECLIRRGHVSLTTQYFKFFQSYEKVLKAHLPSAQSTDKERDEKIREAIRIGLHRGRANFAAQAFDAARASLRARKYFLLLKHLFFASAIYPLQTLGFFQLYLFPGSKPALLKHLDEKDVG